MEIDAALPKGLSKHAVPVVMMIAAVLALSAILLGNYNTASWGTGNPVVKAAVIRVVHIAPARPGFAKVTLGIPAGIAAASPVASSIGNGPPALGREAVLSLNLQTPALSP